MKIIQCRKFVAVLCLLIYSSISIYAQDSKPKKENPYKGLPFKERIFLGGDFGLSFGSFTYIRVAPRLGYLVNERFSIGGGPSYQYFSDNRVGNRYNTSIYGGSVFGQYFILENVFLQTELEVLNLDERFARLGPNNEIIRDRVTIPVLFVGGGYSQRTRGGSGFFIGVFYDVIGDPNSPYVNNLAFRMGGFIGL